jgi:hypothetical protein
MELKNIQSSTFRESQRHLFVQSLYKELDKAAASADARNARLMKRADSLIFDEGLSEDACVDSLILEGFSDDKARQYIESVSLTKKTDSTASTDKYDYTFSDHRGMLFSGREFGELVEASSENEANGIIKKILSSFDPPVNLISINKLS